MKKLTIILSLILFCLSVKCQNNWNPLKYSYTIGVDDSLGFWQRNAGDPTIYNKITFYRRIGHGSFYTTQPINEQITIVWKQDGDTWICKAKIPADFKPDTLTPIFISSGKTMMPSNTPWVVFLPNTTAILNPTLPENKDKEFDFYNQSGIFIRHCKFSELPTGFFLSSGFKFYKD